MTLVSGGERGETASVHPERNPYTHFQMKIRSFHSISSLLVLFGAVTAATLPSASAQTVLTTANGIGADTFIQNTSGTTTNNYGTADIIRVKTPATGSGDRLAYFRFDLGASFTGQSLIGNVSFSLTLQETGSLSDTFELFALSDLSTPDIRATGWSETGVTWNSSQGLRGSGTNPSGSFTSIGTFNLTSNTSGSIISLGSVTSNASTSSGFATNLNSFLQADTNGLVTFAMKRNTSAEPAITVFSPKENILLQPFPTLSFTAVPEPATNAVIIAGGVLGVVMLRRRRRLRA